jgi:ribonuclease-3
MHKLLIFNDEQLLRRALTHSSYANEHPEAIGDNEQLEWLGDRVLNFICGVYLYQLDSEITEKELTDRLKRLVNNKQLSQLAKQIGLNHKILLGNGEIKQDGRQKTKLLSGAFEAIVGAYFLDTNRNYQELFLLLKELFDSVSLEKDIDPKNRLQEFAQKKGEMPEYKTEIKGENAHAPEFISSVYIGDKLYGQGRGKNKKEAENNAAFEAVNQYKL